MSQSHKETHLPDAELKRAWRIVTIAGTLGSIYGIVCFGGALRVKYLSELNATASDFGLMTGLGMFVIAFQILSGYISNRLPRRRAYWLAIAIMHRALFTIVLLAPALFTSDRARIWWIIIVLFFHDTLAQMSVPPWSAWMADLLPRDSMNRYWAGRQRFIMVAQIAILLAAALAFRWFEVRHQVILGYTLLSVIGIVAGLTDLLLFLKVPEPPIEHAMQDHWLETILQPLRDRDFRPFMIYLGYWHFAVFIAAPFFGVCMIEQYKMSAMTVMLLWLASILGTAITSRFWGLLCDTYGYRPVLRIISAGVIILPAFFLLTPPTRVIAFPAIAILFFIDGVVNSGMMLAIQGIQLKMTPRRNRTMYIASANFLSIGLMAGLASILSGYMIDYVNPRFSLKAGPWEFSGYHCAFALSALLRLGSLRFAARLPEAGNISMRAVFEQFKPRNMIGVTRCAYQLQESQYDTMRLKAARLLGDLRSPMGIGALIHALKDPSYAVRKAAANALGRIGGSEAAEALTEALFDPSSDVHPKAARALGRIGDAQSLKALMANLVNQSPRALAETVDSLARIGDSAAILPLICLFHQVKDDPLRQRIVAALGKLGQTESLDEVTRSLQGIQGKPVGN